MHFIFEKVWEPWTKMLHYKSIVTSAFHCYNIGLVANSYSSKHCFETKRWWKRYHTWYQTALLTHWGQVAHMCVGNLTIIGSDNGLSPGRRQVIIWTSVGILLIWRLGTNASETLIEIIALSFRKMRLNVSFAKRQPFYLGLNVSKMPFRVIGRRATIWDHRLHWAGFDCELIW